MENTKLVVPVLLLLAVTLSCKFLSGTTSRNGSNAPAVDFVTTGKPLNVTVQLDKTHTASSKVLKTGGGMSLTAADGSVFTLAVPAKALDEDTMITMTAVKSVTGAPLGNGTPAAVQLEPSGLFFKEVVTLTIVPAKQIPIKEQIVFGYEGNGQDYHLAAVDPKSKDIKIKLMKFSGAGVGSGSDSVWAANLQIQASAASTRLLQKLGEVSQSERQERLLEGDAKDSTEYADKMKSILDQFEDQVVLKEIVAAELDCKHAGQAIQDLLRLERLTQLFFETGSPGFNDKLGKLLKIQEKCAKGYRVAGTSNKVSFTGEICSLDKPFVLNGTFGNGSETQSFTPSNATGGTVKESGNSGGCTQAGGGSYKVTFNEQGSGELQWNETVTGTCPPYSSTKTYTFIVTLKPAPDLSCP